jgi:hypothetical protein
MPTTRAHRIRMLEHLERSVDFEPNNSRVVECAACDGQGRLEFGTGTVSQWDGCEITYLVPCDYCGGTGKEWLTTEPIDMEDLEP